MTENSSGAASTCSCATTANELRTLRLLLVSVACLALLAFVLALVSGAVALVQRGRSSAAEESALRWRAETLREVGSMSATLDVKWQTTKTAVDLNERRIDKLEQQLEEKQP